MAIINNVSDGCNTKRAVYSNYDIRLIKKFLKTNYPRGRAIGVFRSFSFDLKVQKPKFFITPLPKLSPKVLTSPQGEVQRNPGATRPNGVSRAEAPRNSLIKDFLSLSTVFCLTPSPTLPLTREREFYPVLFFLMAGRDIT